jgi:hypothetical protein
LLCLATTGDAHGQEQVTVWARDGRTMSGEVDNRTDDQALWLRFASPSVVLVSALPWDNVARVQWGERHYDAVGFRELAPKLASELPKDFFERAQAERLHPPRNVNGRLYRVPPMRRTPQAVSLVVHARAANWDADAENDGLELVIAPKSSTGDITPLGGQLAIALVGTRYRKAPRESAGRRLGGWSQRVRVEHFGPHGAVYRLPFQSFHPGQDLSVAPSGLLQVRLTASRHPDLHATSPVRLRD